MYIFMCIFHYLFHRHRMSAAAFAKNQLIFKILYISDFYLHFSQSGLSLFNWCHIYLFFYFWPYRAACRILVPWPGRESRPPALGTWTASLCVCSVVSNSLPACQAPLSMGFSRQGYWSGLPFSIPGDFPRNRTHVSCVSCIGRWILYHWTTREAQGHTQIYIYLFF